MKKGFTLIEILVVIVLLSTIIVIAVPSITKIRTNVIEKKAESQKVEIESAGVFYSYDKNVKNCYVKVETLINDKYLKTDQNNDIINPLTNNSLKNNVVKITWVEKSKKNIGVLMNIDELDSQETECE